MVCSDLGWSSCSNKHACSFRRDTCGMVREKMDIHLASQISQISLGQCNSQVAFKYCFVMLDSCLQLLE